MTIDDCFSIYKQIQDESNAIKKPFYEYQNYQIKDTRKRALFQELVNSNIDIKKFFLANETLQKNFFIDYFGYNKDKCFMLYYSWDEFLTKKREEYFHRVINVYRRGIKIDLNNRDAFLSLTPVTDYLFFSTIYPETQELLLSLDSDWIKFNMPTYGSAMDYVRRVTRGNMVLKQMKSFDKLRGKVLTVINK